MAFDESLFKRKTPSVTVMTTFFVTDVGSKKLEGLSLMGFFLVSPIFKARNSYCRGRLSTVDLLALTSLDQLTFMLKILFTCVAKQATLMRRSIVLILPLQLVFPVYGQGALRWDGSPKPVLFFEFVRIGQMASHQPLFERIKAEGKKRRHDNKSDDNRHNDSHLNCLSCNTRLNVFAKMPCHYE